MTTWMTRAACRTADPELFFPISHNGPAGIAATQEAKAVCASCSVQLECLRHTLKNPSEHGVQAGTTPDERRALRALPSPRRPL